MFQTFTALFS